MTSFSNYSTLQKDLCNEFSNNNLTVIPIKDFNNSKSRLKEELDDLRRIDLIKSMLITVINSLGSKCIVVTNSDEVANFAASNAVTALMVSINGLNTTANFLYQNLNSDLFSRLTIIHSDLPMANKQTSPLKHVQTLTNKEFMIYPDINRSGTPVLSIPANLNFKFMYGSRSFQKHISQIESLNAGIKIVEDFNWSFDLDTKFDLLKYYDLSENLEK